MGRILVLAGVNGAGKSSLLGTWLEAEGLSWFNPDSFTRRLVEAGWPLPEANAEAWQEGTRRRTVVDNAKRDRIENFESVNESYVIEDLGCAAMAENITLA